jgi:hypothetical protein
MVTRKDVIVKIKMFLSGDLAYKALAKRAEDKEFAEGLEEEETEDEVVAHVVSQMSLMDKEGFHLNKDNLNEYLDYLENRKIFPTS